MTQSQLNREYSQMMTKAAEAVGRRETMELYKQARSIKKKLHNKKDFM